MKSESQPPVFITGQYRSGTSLMRAILANHPALAMTPYELDWWTRIRPRYPRIQSRRVWHRFLAEIFESPRTNRLELDLAALHARARRRPVGDVCGVFNLIMSRFAEKRGRPRWGDKTPNLHDHVDRILRCHPGAQFIHMVRDPRDTTASYYHARYSEGFHRWLMASPTVVAMTWKRSTAIAERFANDIPRQYRIVRYEDLVADPALTVRAVCRFLGEDYSSELLDLSTARFLRGTGKGNSSFEDHQGISLASVGRSKALMRPSELRLSELILGDRLSRFGYERWASRLTATQSAEFAAFQCPCAAVQAGLWGAIRTARRLAPSLTERRAPTFVSVRETREP